MATSLVASPAGVSAARPGALAGTAARVRFAVLAASLAIAVGLIWDISWHRTVGRDTFWTAPHVLEQLAAIVTGVSCGWLVLRVTFAGTPADRAAGVRFWGFRGPFGAWVCIWGTLMMIVSAPFDNWWHGAYGLDVKIVSPPHMVLLAGMAGIQVGAMLLAVSAQNLAPESIQGRLGLLYAAASAVLVTMGATAIMEYAAFPNEMHSALFYQVTAGVFPILLVATARAGRLRWPATTSALLYAAIVLGMSWTLQLFPATPKLAPIYNPVTHMVPPPFPLLLVVPALGVDLLLQRWGPGRDWRLALMLGPGFVALMLLAHWWWGEFLLTPHARNYFFGVDQWDYSLRLGDWRYRFWRLDRDPAGQWSPGRFARGLAIAAAIGFASARVGLWWGNWMKRVRR
jgi:hypothetical protein